MNTPHMFCYCGRELLKVSAHGHKKTIAIGYYCPVCKIVLNHDMVPLVSYHYVYQLEQDPAVGMIIDLFPDDWRKILPKIMTKFSHDKKDDKKKENPTGTATSRDLEKSFELQVRAGEHKEAAAHQPD